MPVAEANRRSAEVRSERCRQRRDLHGRPPRELIPALVNPTPELASYKLETLFIAQGTGPDRGIIPLLGVQKFRRILTRLHSQGHGWASAETRLRQLSVYQRRLLVNTLLDFAPKAWRNDA